MAYVYRHIRLDKNEPFYIGVGNDTRDFRRAKEKKQRNAYWHRVVAITEYEVEILIDGIPYEDALKKENEFILLYGRRNIGTGCLANLTDGGRGMAGHRLTEEQRERLKRTTWGVNHHFYGTTMSDERKAKIIEANKTRIQSKEQRQATVARNKLRKGIPQKCEHFLELRKPVLRYSFQGEYIDQYESIQAAADVHSCNISTISGAIRGKSSCAVGFLWRYKLSEDFPRRIVARTPLKTDKRPVLRYSMLGEFEAEFGSYVEAAKWAECTNAEVHQAAKSLRKTCCGYLWREKTGNIIPPHINDYIKPKNSLRAVVKYDFDMNELETFCSMRQAAISIGKSDGALIRYVCDGITKSCGGFKWRYK